MSSAHEIRRLRRERDKVLGAAADDIMVVVSLLDEPDRLAEYDFLMAQPRRELSARLKAIDAELAHFSPVIRYR